MKNAEQITALVNKKMKTAAAAQAAQEQSDDASDVVAEPEALDALKDGMRIVLSRPDQDGVRGELYSRLRRELNDLNSLEGAMASLAQEAIDALKTSSSSTKVQLTYIYLLENMMSEIKPDFESNPALKKIIEDVRDANIQISDRLRKEQKLRSMAKPISPSETAAKILPKGGKKK
jgi:hypothetical protein